MFFKIHKTYRYVFAVCDSDLIGRTFEEGNFQLEVKENFFKGDTLKGTSEKIGDENVNLKIDGSSTSKNSIIAFISENNAKTISYPEQKNVQLSEGNYEITVNVYDDSELNIGATTKEQCYEVPRGAVGGFFGLTKKECVDINFPEQTISIIPSTNPFVKKISVAPEA